MAAWAALRMGAAEAEPRVRMEVRAVEELVQMAAGMAGTAVPGIYQRQAGHPEEEEAAEAATPATIPGLLAPMAAWP